MEKFVTVEKVISNLSEILKRSIYESSLRRFLTIFGINYLNFTVQDKRREYWRSGLRLKQKFYGFLISNISLFDDFDKDYYSNKSYEDVAAKLKVNVSYVIAAVERMVKDGRLTVYFNKHNKGLQFISSYQILYEIKNDLPKLNFGELNKKEKSGLLGNLNNQRPKVFGDIFDNIVEELEPIFDPIVAKEWGLKKPAGILLYGPPGCGKTYWAKQIAVITELKLVEIHRGLLNNYFSNASFGNFAKLVNEIKKTKDIILFIDEFESIASESFSNKLTRIGDSKIVSAFLKEMPSLIEKNIILVAATNSIDKLDPAVLKPGRFNLMLPVFPPLPNERIELLLNFITEDLRQNSIPAKLFKSNSTDTIAFWLHFKEYLNLYSLNLLKDLASVIVRNAKRFHKEKGDNFTIDGEFIANSIKITSSKISPLDVEYYVQFLNEIEKVDFTENFSRRREQLRNELFIYYNNSGLKESPKPIGFKLPII